MSDKKKKKKEVQGCGSISKNTYVKYKYIGNKYKQIQFSDKNSNIFFKIIIYNAHLTRFKLKYNSM